MADKTWVEKLEESKAAREAAEKAAEQAASSSRVNLGGTADVNDPKSLGIPGKSFGIPQTPAPLEFSREGDTPQGREAVFPQGQEVDDIYQRLEKAHRKATGSSETHIDPVSGEIREFAKNPQTGDGGWMNYGLMNPTAEVPPPPPPAKQAELDLQAAPAGEDIQAKTRRLYDLPPESATTTQPADLTGGDALQLNPGVRSQAELLASAQAAAAAAHHLASSSVNTSESQLLAQEDQRVRQKYGWEQKEPIDVSAAYASRPATPDPAPPARNPHGQPYLAGMEPEAQPQSGPTRTTAPGTPNPTQPPNPNPNPVPPPNPNPNPNPNPTPPPLPPNQTPNPNPNPNQNPNPNPPQNPTPPTPNLNPNLTPHPSTGGGGAQGWSQVTGGIGYAIGSSAGGPLGGSIGMLAGNMLGTVIGGGQVKPGDALKSVGALAGGALFGKAGGMIGGALGEMLGGSAGGGGGGGSTSVSGAGGDGEGSEVARLLREISINIKSMVNEGIFIKGNHRQGQGSSM